MFNGFVSYNMEKIYSLFVQCLHGAEKRSLFIQCFATVGAECCRNVKCSVFNECRRSWIPCSISSCLEGGTQSAGGETGSIRFTFYKFLTGEIHDYLSIACWRDKAVMFFCCYVCHWLKPVCIMCCSVFYCPFFHGNSYRICNIQFKVGAVLNCLF